MSRSLDGQSSVVSPSQSKWNPPVVSEIETFASKAPIPIPPVALVQGSTKRSGPTGKPAVSLSSADKQPGEPSSCGVSDSGPLRGTDEEESATAQGLWTLSESGACSDEDSSCSITSLLQSPVSLGDPPTRGVRYAGKSHFTSLGRAALSLEQKSLGSTYEDIDLSTPVDVCTTSLLEPRETHPRDLTGTPEVFRTSGHSAPALLRRPPLPTRPVARPSVGYFSCFLPWTCAVGGGVHSQGYQTGSTSPEEEGEDSSPEERGCYRWQGSWMGTEAPSSSYESPSRALPRQGSDAPGAGSRIDPHPPPSGQGYSGGSGHGKSVSQEGMCSGSGLPVSMSDSPGKLCSASSDVRNLMIVNDKSCNSISRNNDFLESEMTVAEDMLPPEDVARAVSSSSAKKVALPSPVFTSSMPENIGSHEVSVQRPFSDPMDCAIVAPGDQSTRKLASPPESCRCAATGELREVPCTIVGHYKNGSRMQSECTDSQRVDSLMRMAPENGTSDGGNTSALGKSEFSSSGAVKNHPNYRMESDPGASISVVLGQCPQESKCSSSEPDPVTVVSSQGLPQSTQFPGDSARLHQSCERWAAGCRQFSIDSIHPDQDSRQAPQCSREQLSLDSSHPVLVSRLAPQSSRRQPSLDSSHVALDTIQAPQHSRQQPSWDSSQSYPHSDLIEHPRPTPDSSEPLPGSGQTPVESGQLSEVSGQVSAEPTPDPVETRQPFHQPGSPNKSPTHPRSRRGRRLFLLSARHRRQQLSAMSSSEEDWSQLFHVHRAARGSATSRSRLPRTLHLRQDASGAQSMEAEGGEEQDPVPCRGRGSGMPCNDGDKATSRCTLLPGASNPMSSSGSLADMSSADTPTKTTFDEAGDDGDKSSSLLDDDSSCSLRGDDATFDLGREEDIAMLSDNQTAATSCPCCRGNTANGTDSQSISAGYHGCYDNLGMDTDSDSQPQQLSCKDGETCGDSKARMERPGTSEYHVKTGRGAGSVDGQGKPYWRSSAQDQARGSLGSAPKDLMTFHLLSKQAELVQPSGALKPSSAMELASNHCSKSGCLSNGSFPTAESSSQRFSELGNSSAFVRGGRQNDRGAAVLSDAEVAAFVTEKLRLSHGEVKETNCADSLSNAGLVGKGCARKSATFGVATGDGGKKTECVMEAQSSLDVPGWKDESLERKRKSAEDMSAEDCLNSTSSAVGFWSGRLSCQAAPLPPETMQQDDPVLLRSGSNETAEPPGVHTAASNTKLSCPAPESQQTRSCVDFVPSTNHRQGNNGQFYIVPVPKSPGFHAVGGRSSREIACPSGGSPTPDANQPVSKCRVTHSSAPPGCGVSVASTRGQGRQKTGVEMCNHPQAESSMSKAAHTSLAETVTWLPTALLNLRPITVMALRQFDTTTTPSRHQGAGGGGGGGGGRGGSGGSCSGGSGSGGDCSSAGGGDGGLTLTQSTVVDLSTQHPLLQGDPSPAARVPSPQTADSPSCKFHRVNEGAPRSAKACSDASSPGRGCGSEEKPADWTSSTRNSPSGPNTETSCSMEVDGSEEYSRISPSSRDNPTAGPENQSELSSGRNGILPPAQASRAAHSLSRDLSQNRQGVTSGDVERNSDALEVRYGEEQNRHGVEGSTDVTDAAGSAAVSRNGVTVSATPSDVNSGLDQFSRHGGNAVIAREQMRIRLASMLEADHAHSSLSPRGTSGALTEGDRDQPDRPRRNYSIRRGGLNSFVRANMSRGYPSFVIPRTLAQNSRSPGGGSDVRSDPDAPSQVSRLMSSLQDADPVLGGVRRLLRRHGFTGNVGAPSEAVSDSGSEDGGSEDEDSYSADDEFDCDCEACARLRQMSNRGNSLPRISYQQPEILSSESGRINRSQSSNDAQGVQGNLLPQFTMETDMLQQIIGFTGNAHFVGGLPVFDSPVEEDIGSVDVVPQWLADELIWNSLPPVGLSDATIARLPVSPAAEGDVGGTCVICQQEVMEGEELIHLPCVHSFHQQCLRHWLSRAGSCPICRRKVE